MRIEKGVGSMSGNELLCPPPTPRGHLATVVELNKLLFNYYADGLFHLHSVVLLQLDAIGLCFGAYRC